MFECVCVPYTLSPGDINITGRHVEQGKHTCGTRRRLKHRADHHSKAVSNTTIYKSRVSPRLHTKCVYKVIGLFCCYF